MIQKRKLFRLFATIFILVYLTYAAIFFFYQRRILFQGQSGDLLDKSPPPDAEVWWLNVGGAKIEAWLLPSFLPHKKKTPVLIAAHGNSDTIHGLATRMDGARALGFSVLLIEYPGYGQSTGTPSQKTITEAYVTAYDKLLQTPAIDPERIVLFGQSLGGGVVTQLVANRSSIALILVSTFSSVKDIARDLYLPRFLVRDPFQTDQVVLNYHHPVLLLHGTKDTLIPSSHSNRLHHLSPNSQLILRQCNHNDCILDWDSFWKKDVKTFLHRNNIFLE